MTSSQEFAQWVVECMHSCDTVLALGEVTLRRMFGEYCLYIAGRPVALICDDICFVKQLPEIEPTMTAAQAGTGYPYDGARLHWILDPEERELVTAIMPVLFAHSAVPKKRKRRQSAKPIDPATP